jgi:PIN domain nuclease of toxin-antitoxin system
MEVLLDTSVFLWMISKPERLSKKARAIIESKDNELFISAVSGWEITIKFQINKLKLPDKPEVYVPNQIKENLLEVLPIEMKHVLNIYNLPDIHKDPFDRLLISQSQLEKLPILTKDKKIKKYSVKTIW